MQSPDSESGSRASVLGIVDHVRSESPRSFERPGAATATVHTPAGPAWQHRVKRVIDVVGAGLGLVVLAPAMGLLVFLIRRDSPGPAIFRQTRMGRDGKAFTFYKFRTMQDGNDAGIHREYVSRLIKGDSEGELRGENGALKMESDPRVTRLGRVLRRTSIDELPQLLNVVRGEMSLVGPRPPLPYEVGMYEARHLRRLEVLPGITGLWQVSGRTHTSFERMVDLDTAYIDTWSLWLDVKILYRTIGVVLSREGAW